MNTEPIIYFAPLQGYTDNDYRETHFNVMGNIDLYFAPYLCVENDGRIKSVAKFLPSEELNHKKILIPQVLPGNIEELKLLAACVIENGFSELNINLGCPYPMVTNRGRGSALIQKPELVNTFLEYITDELNLKTSLKIRVGLSDPDEIFCFLKSIDKSRSQHIIIHPRTAKQRYKGKADVFVFKKCAEMFPELNLIYNGDIKCFDDIVELREIMPFQNKFMIGRGLIANPFLAWQLKNDTRELPSNYKLLLHNFAIQLFDSILKSSNDEHHALNRIRTQMLALFEENSEMKKISKQFKKSKSMNEIRKIIDFSI